MQPARSAHRPAPGPLPSWADADYVGHNISEFQRTGLHELFATTAEQLRPGLPGLVGMVELDGIGHWVQHEAAAAVNEQLVKFLRG